MQNSGQETEAGTETETVEEPDYWLALHSVHSLSFLLSFLLSFSSLLFSSSSSSLLLYFGLFEIGSHYVNLVGLELAM